MLDHGEWWYHGWFNMCKVYTIQTCTLYDRHLLFNSKFTYKTHFQTLGTGWELKCDVWDRTKGHNRYRITHTIWL